MIFLHPVQLCLSEHPNSGVRMMEAGGVLGLKVDKIIVGEVGVICAAADTGRRKTVMQIAVRADPSGGRLLDSFYHAIRDKGIAVVSCGAGKTIEKDRRNDG